MDWHDWEPHYRQIIERFGYSMESDREAAVELAGLLKDADHDQSKGLERLGRLMAGNPVEVVGAAMDPGTYDPPTGAVVVAADGTVEGMEEAGVEPQVVVTDLDGPREALERASGGGAGAGALMVVHAHGDNRKLLRWGTEALSPVLGTCQCRPVSGLSNFGGFTDGDRAVYLAASLGAVSIRLVGFDYERLGPYSHHRDPATKLAKLDWARRLIEMVSRYHDVPVVVD